jgi:hypothetical protein
LAAHKGEAAANEFQKILSHRNIMIGDPVFVLAHVGLARAYALSGEPSKARAQYEEVFALWKNADPDSPVLKRAKTEFGTCAVQSLSGLDLRACHQPRQEIRGSQGTCSSLLAAINPRQVPIQPQSNRRKR